MVNKTAKNSKRGRRQRRRRQPRAAMSESNDRVENHTHMVMDPCHAKISPTAYRGMDGFVQRFARTQALTTTTEACFITVYYPAYNSSFTATVATAATSIPAVVYNTPGPGQSFLLTNSDSQRAIGACLQIDYTGTELNRQGLLYMGSLKSSVFASATTVDQLTAILGNPRRVPDATVEVKWIPSPVDEEYWPSGAAAPEGSGDRNVIVIVGTGIASATAFQITTTLIAEWQPNQGLGLAANNPNTADAPAGMERVRSNLASAGNWWVSAAHTLETGYRTAQSVYKATRGLRGGLLALTM